MPKEKFVVAYDLQAEGAGSEATKAGTTVLKGELLPPQQLVKGLVCGIAKGKVCQLEAESAAEAIQIAGEQYGNRGGVGGAWKASSGEFASQ